MSGHDEIHTASFTTYGQWAAVLSILLLILLGLLTFRESLTFSVIGWAISMVMTLVEIPFCWKCCPGPTSDSILRFLNNCWFRFILYICFAIAMWFSIWEKGFLFITAVSLTLTALFYGLAAFKGQEIETAPLEGSLMNSHV